MAESGSITKWPKPPTLRELQKRDLTAAVIRGLVPDYSTLKSAAHHLAPGTLLRAFVGGVLSTRRARERHERTIREAIAQFPTPTDVVITDKAGLLGLRDGFRLGNIHPASTIQIHGPYSQTISKTYGAFYRKSGRETQMSFALFDEGIKSGIEVGAGNPASIITLVMQAYAHDKAHDYFEKEMQSHPMADLIREFLRNGVELTENDGDVVTLRWGRSVIT